MSSGRVSDRNLRSMAIAPSPNSKTATISSPMEKKRKNTVSNSISVDVDEIKSDSQPQKRSKNPGVRVIGGRIYDSENGTTCHQCRQKTHAVYAACKNQANTKPCSLKYCQTCLLNRYGEKTEDVVLLDQWDCPKCKGVCNCSICMKKRGHQPTGMVVQMAKLGGFTSVSDMIHVKGAQNVSNYKRVKETMASPRKLASPTEVIMITSSKKLGKENLFDGNTDSNANPVPTVPPPVKEKLKKKKRKGSEVKHEDSKVDVSATEIDQALNKNKKKLKAKGSKEIVGGDVGTGAIEKVNGAQQPEKDNKTSVHNRNVIISKTKAKKIKGPKRIVEGDASTSAIEKVNNDAQHLETDNKTSVQDGNVIIPKAKETKAKKIKGSKGIVGENISTSAVVKVDRVEQVGKNIKKCVDDGKDLIHENKKPKAKKVKGTTGVVGENVITGATEKVNGVQQQENDIKKNIQEGGVVIDDKCDKKAKQHMENNKSSKLKGNVMNSCTNIFEAVIPLPTGTDLVRIAGVDLPKEDAGNALQLLEFCSTFGKILDVKKGQVEAVLRELIKGRSTRRGKFTSVIQFHIQLLSVIQEETESESESESPVLDQTPGNDSWLKALKSCISNSQNTLENMDCLDKKAGGYDNLDSSTKLRLLVFLCDEVLVTEKIRNWIDDQTAKFKEKKKEAKDKLHAAKDKEKSLKQKMLDDIAKAIIAKEGVPLSLKEHDAIVSKIKNQADEAHAEMLACKGMVPIDKEKADAVRTEPFFRDNNGHVYWRLKGCSDKPGILLQDIGTADHTVSVVDKWFEYDAEQIDLIEKHINVLRSRFRKVYKN